MKRLVLAVTLSQAVGSAAFAQTVLWSRLYEPFTRTLNAQDVVVDRDGNAHTTATDPNELPASGPPAGEMYVVKFDGAGKKLWSQNQPGQAMALDGKGNVFVVGTRRPPGVKTLDQDDITVTKFSSDGKRLWQKVLGTPAADWATGIAVDGSGNVYVSGGTQGSFVKQTSRRDPDACLVKLDGDGNTLWTRSWGSPGLDDRARGVGTDGEGNIYLRGDFGRPLDDQASAGTQPFYVIMVDATGTEKWKHAVSRDAGSVYNVINDEEGNLYAVGQTIPYAVAPRNEGQIYVTRFDQRRQEQWTRLWDSAGIKEIHGLAADRAGNLHVAGTLDQSKEQSCKLVLLVYSKDGVLLSEQLQPITCGDHINAIALDAKGKLFMTGTTRRRPGGLPYDGRFRMFLEKYPVPAINPATAAPPSGSGR